MRVHIDFRLLTTGSHIPFTTFGKSFRRQFFTHGLGKLYLFSFAIHQYICQRIETKVSGNRQCHRQFGGSDKGVRIRITVCTFSKITIERGYDRILASRVICLTFPLTNTGTAGVCHNCSTDFFKSSYHTIPLCCSPYPFGTGVHNQGSGYFQVLLFNLAGQGNGTT